ncbi:MAG: hypothetical protein ACREVI_04360 [Steroidobacteraceae bacterium]
MNSGTDFDRMAHTGRMRRVATACAGMMSSIFASAALAYVGPGAGLGMVVAFFAMILAVLATLFGLVLWPIRYLARRRKAAAAGTAPPESNPPPSSAPEDA